MSKRPRKYDPTRDIDLFGLAVTYLLKDEKFDYLNLDVNPLQFGSIDSALSYAAHHNLIPQASDTYQRFDLALRRELNKGRKYPKHRQMFYWSVEPWLLDHFHSAKAFRLPLSEFSRHPKVLEYKLAWLLHLSKKYREGDLRV